eukprot:TRINITY_DN49998_c0_g1_i1.p1 TRINITY_DN49998_c0_g1~~TRINITY_DN49998_c0_g1_i1.p1  ORF type:complete len:416 (+),score=49.48 TRINITY_DN49998_c0_g1_i1:67-1314(+)
MGAMRTPGRRFREVFAAVAARYPLPGRRSSPRGGAATDDESLGASLVDSTATGAAQLAPGVPPRRGRVLAWLRRARDAVRRLPERFQRRKGQAVSGSSSTLTDSSCGCSPIIQVRTLCRERATLSPKQSSSFQPEAKQGSVDRPAAIVADLQRQQTALQARLQQLSVHNMVAEQQWGLLLQEAEDRNHVLLTMNNELGAFLLAFSAARVHNADGDQATEQSDEIRCVRDDAAPTGTAAEELILPEPSARSSTYAMDCFSIDMICHWVGSFVHRDWACVCSTFAQGVHRALAQRHEVWYTTAQLIGRFQSAGVGHQTDNRNFGPVPGPLVAVREVVLDLRKNVVATHTGDARWRDRFALHMQIIAHTYDEMRLRLRQVLATAANLSADMDYVLATLEEALEMRSDRLAAAAGGEPA